MITLLIALVVMVLVIVIVAGVLFYIMRDDNGY